MLRRIAPVLLVTTLAIAACTTDDHPAPPGTRDPATTTTGHSTPTTTGETPRPTAAPPVTKPVDLRPLRDHPCAALTQAQQNTIGFRPYEPSDHEAVNSAFSNCRWLQKSGPNNDIDHGYHVWLWSSDPLAKAYAEANDPAGSWAVFEPREIRGLPAVVRSLGTPDEQCSVVVGTGNGQGIEVDGVTSTADPTLCERFTTAAEWIVDAARK